MTESAKPLRRGWTTGACATAATKAALIGLWGGSIPEKVTITLPKGGTPTFDLAETALGPGWAEAAIVKDAGDDPDVTHRAMIRVRVAASAGGVTFAAGHGVGTVTKPGLPIEVGEPAINPVPRAMMDEVVAEVASDYGKTPDIAITVSVDNGAELALKTWNPRLGIIGGLSILGTTGIVRPFSCAAWIASIHRGIDVARAEGLTHVSGCTGATSEKVVQSLYGLPDGAMLDMGDFVGGLGKYLRRHPVDRLTIGGGIGKIEAEDPDQRRRCRLTAPKRIADRRAVGIKPDIPAQVHILNLRMGRDRHCGPGHVADKGRQGPRHATPRLGIAAEVVDHRMSI